MDVKDGIDTCTNRREGESSSNFSREEELRQFTSSSPKKDDKSRRRHRKSAYRSDSSESYEEDNGNYKKIRSRRRTKSQNRSRSPSPKREHRKREGKKGNRKRRKRRTRSRSSSTENGKYSQRRRHRSESSSSDSNSSDYNSFSRRRHYRCRDRPDYLFQEPNTTVMVRGLALQFKEEDIIEDLRSCGLMAKDVRLIKDYHTGASRGYAFVEFKWIEDATRWMDIKKGTLVLQDQFHANLMYSVPKTFTSEDGTVAPLIDWLCRNCNSKNFRRRTECYKCSASRPVAIPDMNKSDGLTTTPTATVALSNLDTLTTEEGILQAFKKRPELSAVPIQKIGIVRERQTSISTGICHVKASSINDATQIFASLVKERIQIDGREISVAYVNSPDSEQKNQKAATAMAAARWLAAESAVSTSKEVLPFTNEEANMQEEDIEKMATYSASIYAKSHQEYLSYLEYYRQYFREQQGLLATHGLTHGPVTDDACTNDLCGSSSKECETVSSDWKTSIAASACDDSTNGATKNTTSDGIKDLDLSKEKPKRKGTKKTKIKIDANVTKLMGKWANASIQKVSSTSEKKPTKDAQSLSSSSSAYCAWTNYPWSGTASVDFDDKLQSQWNVASSFRESEYRDHETEDGDGDEQKWKCSEENWFIDENRMACLLCRRLFSDMVALHKHVKLSKLHQQNFEAHQQRQSSAKVSTCTNKDADIENR